MEILLEGVSLEVGIFISALEMVGVDLVAESLQAKNKKRVNIIVRNFM
jgi:hypothetical protein